MTGARAPALRQARAWGWREALLLVAAVPLGLALPRLLGLPATGRLAGTLQVLPLVLAGLVAVERAVIARGGRRPGRRVLALGALGLGAWLLLVAARPRAWLAVPAPVAATALFALLGTYLALLVPRLRPLLGRRLPAMPPAVFFWVPLLAYLAVLPWCTAERPPDGDEPYYLLVAHSLAVDGDAELTDNYARGDSLAFLPRRLEPQPGDPVGPDGELYSRHNVLLPLLLAPAYRLGSALDAGARGAFLLMAVLTAALAWATLRLARHYCAERPGAALLAWALFALLPPLLLYSHQVWVEVPAALLVVLALDALPGRATTRRELVLFAAALALLPLLKLRFALFSLLLVALAWWRSGRRLGLLVAGGAVGALVAGILLFNSLRYGSAMKTFHLADLFAVEPLPGVLARALGLFFDVGFGLFAAAPLWLLLLAALPPLLRRPSPLRTDLLLLALPYLALLAYRREWYGGWSPPFRYGLALLPLLALALVPALAARHRGGGRLLAAALAAPTAALTLLWLAVPGWTYNLADGGNHLLDLLSQQTRLDLARLFPSALRLRPATWWWPAVALPAMILLWRWPRRFHRLLPAAGIALALLAPAVALAAAAQLPTRRVELEDPHVTARGGFLFPPQWTFDRLRFRAGWAIREGSSVEVPVVPGGERVAVRLAMRSVQRSARQGELVLRAGERVLARLPAPRGHAWREATVPAQPWPAGAALVLEVRAPPGEGRRVTVGVDYLELEWE